MTTSNRDILIIDDELQIRKLLQITRHENGHDTLRKLGEWSKTPLIILSVQNKEADIIRTLDNGANGYLVKPFRTGELLARIRTALRACAP
jgi:DNA-binding response OmpR family regulator